MKLYGIEVKGADYRRLKRLADTLTQFSDPAEGIAQARNRCLRVALDAVRAVRLNALEAEDEGPYCPECGGPSDGPGICEACQPPAEDKEG